MSTPGTEAWRNRLLEVLEEMALRCEELYPDNRPKLSEILDDPDAYPKLEEDALYMGNRWWLSGAAEAMGVTVLELLWECDITEEQMDSIFTHVLPCDKKPCRICDQRVPYTVAKKPARRAKKTKTK